MGRLVTDDVCYVNANIEWFELTQEESTFYEQHLMPFVDKYINKKGITNEDLIQDIHLYCMYILSNTGIESITKPKISMAMYTFTRAIEYYTKRKMKQVSIKEDFIIVDYHDSFIYFNLKDNLELILSTLTKTEQTEIRLRFFNSLTLDEIGEVFGLSRERIRQIQTRALRKCRHPSRSRLVKDFAYSDYFVSLYDKNNFIKDYIKEVD